MKTGFFEEAPGVKSAIRLQMFMTMIFTFFVIGYQVYTKEVDYLLCLTLLVASFVPKLLQKFAEAKTATP
jgi:hypothetical protein